MTLNFDLLTSNSVPKCTNARAVTFLKFYFSIREFQISRLVEYSKLNSALWLDRHTSWMLQYSRHHAVQLWLGGGPWEVERKTDAKQWRCQITKHACLSHVLVLPTDCYHLRLITLCGCNCWTMNSLSRTNRLGRVYSLEWLSKSWSVTDAVLNW